jgi:hypothetical protein
MLVDANIVEGYDERQWKEMFRKVFFKHIGEEKDQKNVFTSVECRKMIDYIILGYGQHFHLFRQFSRYPQQRKKTTVKKWVEVKTTEPHSLSSGVLAEKWEEHCQKEKEMLDKEIKEREDEENKKREERERILANEEAEKHSAMLKQRLCIII